MESQPATMTKASWAVATPLRYGLPEELVVWEILVRLPPKSLLRCRAVCRAWRCATSTRLFLQAHHGRQPSLPIVAGYKYPGAPHESILAFDHLAASARLQPVAQLDDSFFHDASCDGILILSKYGRAGACFSVCNPATRQHAALRQLSGFSFFGMYQHRPTGEYRLLLHQTLEDKISVYVYTLGSEQPPRYTGGLEVATSSYLLQPAMVRNSLHWYPLHYQCDPHEYQTEVVMVFGTTSEAFRQMRAPVAPAKSYIFEIDDTLGIHNFNNDRNIVDIWILQNYESEVWTHKYKVKLPVENIKKWLGHLNGDWNVRVHSVNGDVFLLVNHGGWMFYVDINGKLVDNFHRDGQYVYAWKFQLKQTLVQHTFFTTLEDYDVNASPLAIE